MSIQTDREKALELLKEYNQTESLVNHGLAVSGVMSHFAGLEGEDPEYWGLVGLLHDLDYEKYPDQHCVKVVEILTANGYDQAFINSIVSHGYGICSEVEPTHQMEKILYAIDELTGLITACAYMRPSKSVNDLEVKSVKKKFKTTSFAAGVNREVVTKGAEMAGYSLDDLMKETILGMRAVADDIGLGSNEA
ncbi:HDIG domain-containing metalloprotein [Acetobacterium woodii]|uniref:Putative metal dependent phosphohydrolase, HDIG domain protein n=1 Tax=Acetobacterium woodii (strain ATCC 29683 / DSM 1030 / JCM 2381 / KCTC 1655 / WB1) TaxID=931626 RepID=H6LJ44_ACEWD|nr:HDIG domain-containing metalloprotein [Acetobacterium woodii]AFA47407.1 putative metal dependent phosphohydrolase, HDIG domain protein [Acetobacterium woodii DSM 1030]